MRYGAWVAWLLAASFAMPAQAQGTDEERDAEIARLRETVDRLVQRIEVLESEREGAPEAPEVRAVPPAAPPPTPAASAPPAPEAWSGVADTPAMPMPVPEQSPLPAHPSFSEDELATSRVDNELAPGEDGQEGFFPVRGTSTWLRLSGYAKAGRHGRHR